MRASRESILILSFIILLTIPGIFSDFSGEPVALNQQDSVYENNIGPSAEDNFLDRSPILAEIPSSTTGSGLLIGVKEYANGTFVGRTAYGNDTSTFYTQIFDIPEGWYTTSITAISSQMYHLRDWVENGAFSSTVDPWVYDDSGDTVGAVSGSYNIGEYIEITRVSGGKVKYDYNGEWVQSVDVTEGGTAS
ncbi:MAG: hypothetical protein P1Q69_09070, partial [Candidatus Thorarchaeota archaeon]|nr:hypothetical protein [Candidatus Thorarchaeota archaeon]